MEGNSEANRKITPSIPANYISIRHLQQRWINEKDRKRKEEEEKQVVEQQTIEDDLKKTEEARGQRDEKKRLDPSNRKNWGRNSRNKEPTNGGDAKFAEKEEPEITAAIVSERGEDAAAPKKDRGFRRKRYKSKKKKNQDVDVVEDVVFVASGSESIAPLAEVVVTEKITPVKDVIRVYRKKGEKSTGKKRVEYREKNQDVAVVEEVAVDYGCRSMAPPPEVVVTEKITPVKDVNRKKGGKATGKKSVEYIEKAVTVTVDAATAIETQFEDLSIKNGETKNLKSQTRSSNRNRINQGNDLVHQRVRRPIGGAAASTMVWVKKEQKERAGDGIANGVKPFNA